MRSKSALTMSPFVHQSPPKRSLRGLLSARSWPAKRDQDRGDNIDSGRAVSTWRGDLQWFAEGSFPFRPTAFPLSILRFPAAISHSSRTTPRSPHSTGIEPASPILWMPWKAIDESASIGSIIRSPLLFPRKREKRTIKDRGYAGVPSRASNVHAASPGGL